MIKREMASIESQWSDTFEAARAGLDGGVVDYRVRFGDPVAEILLYRAPREA